MRFPVVLLHTDDFVSGYVPNLVRRAGDGDHPVLDPEVVPVGFERLGRDVEQLVADLDARRLGGASRVVRHEAMPAIAAVKDAQPLRRRGGLGLRRWLRFLDIGASGPSEKSANTQNLS